MADKICSETDCQKKHYARGLCADHYTKWRMINNPRRCSVDGCDRAYKGRGLCQKHLDLWRRSPEAVVVYGRCSRRGCANPRRSRGLCDTHAVADRRV